MENDQLLRMIDFIPLVLGGLLTAITTIIAIVIREKKNLRRDTLFRRLEIAEDGIKDCLEILAEMEKTVKDARISVVNIGKTDDEIKEEISRALRELMSLRKMAINISEIIDIKLMPGSFNIKTIIINTNSIARRAENCASPSGHLFSKENLSNEIHGINTVVEIIGFELHMLRLRWLDFLVGNTLRPEQSFSGKVNSYDWRRFPDINSGRVYDILRVGRINLVGLKIAIHTETAGLMKDYGQETAYISVHLFNVNFKFSVIFNKTSSIRQESKVLKWAKRRSFTGRRKYLCGDPRNKD